MELSEVVQQRRMVRSFDRRPVDAGALDRVLDAARRGPSAGFSQGLDLFVLAGAEQTGRYWDLAFSDQGERDRFRWQGLFAAPVLVIPLVAPEAYLARYRESDKAPTNRTELSGWPVPYWWVDGGMAVMLALLAAVDEGLGALFFTLEHPDAVLHSFGVPADRSPLGTIALGYPAPGDAGRSSRRPRRPVDDVVHRGHW